MNYGSNDPQIQETQYQRTKADIKNVLPYDLYDAMVRAAMIKSELIADSTPKDRQVRDFVRLFDTVFQFTKQSISDQLAGKIEKWLESKPKKENEVNEGIKLFYKYYDELTKLGIGRMFEEPVIPPIGIESLLEEGISDETSEPEGKGVVSNA